MPCQAVCLMKLQQTGCHATMLKRDRISSLREGTHIRYSDICQFSLTRLTEFGKSWRTGRAVLARGLLGGAAASPSTAGGDGSDPETIRATARGKAMKRLSNRSSLSGPTTPRCRQRP
eukprot:scaffold182651_cov41-Prasinocladus_malaysianus.AAC.1